MTSNIKYIGMDVHKESISIAVRNFVGKVVMESVIETKASMILQFLDGLRGDELQNGARLGLDDAIHAAFHQHLTDRVHHCNRNALRVYI